MDRPAPHIAVTGCILAGGEGRRLGGVDKGLIELAGRPLVAHVGERLAPQVDAMLINANRNLERYRTLGWPVVGDLMPGYAGPLAGLAAAMAAATTPHVVLVPCDSPLVPLDLVARLAHALSAAAAEISVVRAAGRLQPVFALIERTLAADLAAYLHEGGRKIDLWYARRHVVEVDFGQDDQAFVNVNTPADLAEVARRIARA